MLQRQLKKCKNKCGGVVLDKNGIAKKGLIIRHLVLPGHIENTKKVLLWLKQNIIPDVFISVMAQYFPTANATEDKDLGRKLTFREYKKIEEYLYELNFKNGYVQSLEDCEEKYVPNF